MCIERHADGRRMGRERQTGRLGGMDGLRSAVRPGARSSAATPTAPDVAAETVAGPAARPRSQTPGPLPPLHRPPAGSRHQRLVRRRRRRHGRRAPLAAPRGHPPAHPGRGPRGVRGARRHRRHRGGHLRARRVHARGVLLQLHGQGRRPRRPRRARAHAPPGAPRRHVRRGRPRGARRPTPWRPCWPAIVDRILRSIPVDRQLSLIQTELEIFAIRRPDHARRFLETNNRFRERIGALIDEAMRRYGRELLVDPSVITDAIVAIAERSVQARPPGRWRRGPGRDGERGAAGAAPGALEARRGLTPRRRRQVARPSRAGR